MPFSPYSYHAKLLFGWTRRTRTIRDFARELIGIELRCRKPRDDVRGGNTDQTQPCATLVQDRINNGAILEKNSALQYIAERRRVRDTDDEMG